jgi:hypothetical protein
MPDGSRPTTRELVLVPAIITLAVTALRLVGELQGWSPILFNRAGGGPGSIVGIVWLMFVFGAWFAVKLARAGEGPSSIGRPFAFVVLGIVVFAASIALTAVTKMSQMRAAPIIFIMALVAGGVAARGWPSLGRVLFVYALAARVPVAALMLPAIIGHWGTHYDALPPGFPPMDPVKTWVFIGLFPQMTLWIGFTLIGGMLAGAIAAAALRGRRQEAVASAA